MSFINHSNRQPLGNKLIAFIDSVGAWKNDKGQFVNKEGGFMLVTPEYREEQARRATTGIIMAMGKNCFKDIHEDEKPMIGDRITFTSYSGLHKVEGDNFYRSLQDSEIHDWYIPQRNQIINKTE